MKVTVAIPTYNNLKDLKRALESVFMQDFEDYEIIIADNSTNSETEEYIKGLNHPKIDYFRNIPPVSPSANWNKMLDKSQGEYIKILFDDDWFLTKDALGKMVNLMDEHPEADFGYCRQIGFKRGTNKVVHRRAQKYVKRLQKDPMELMLANRISAPSVIIVRKSFPVRFDEQIVWGNDADYYISAILHNNNIAFLNEELVALGCPETQLTQTYEKNAGKIICDIFRIYAKFKTHVKNSKYKNKIHKSYINWLKKFKIDSLETLTQYVELDTVPEFVEEYFVGKSKNIVAKTLDFIGISMRGGGLIAARLLNLFTYFSNLLFYIVVFFIKCGDFCAIKRRIYENNCCNTDLQQFKRLETGAGVCLYARF